MDAEEEKKKVGILYGATLLARAQIEGRSSKAAALVDAQKLANVTGKTTCVVVYAVLDVAYPADDPR